MIKLLDLLRENVNPFYKDYGNYLFGGNASLYGKVVEEDTKEEIKIQRLLGKWAVGFDVPKLIPYLEKLYSAKKYYPYILDPGNVRVWKGIGVWKNENFINFVKNTKFVKYNDSPINAELLVSTTYFDYQPSFGAQSWSVDMRIPLLFSMDLEEGASIFTTTTTSSKFLFRPFIIYTLPSKYSVNEYLTQLSSKEAVGEKEIIGLGNHKVKAIIRKSYYDSIINSSN
jgi:hypothetical protein